MRTRMLAAGFVAAMILGPVAGHATPSQYCGGNPTPTQPTYKVDLNRSSVCFNILAVYKGSLNADLKNSSVYVDGDGANYSTNPCLDGYVGANASGTPYLVWSQGKDYDPTKPAVDGGTHKADAGSVNDKLDVQGGEQSEITDCFDPRT